MTTHGNFAIVIRIETQNAKKEDIKREKETVLNEKVVKAKKINAQKKREA